MLDPSMQVAGAAAAAGLSLEEVKAEAEAAAASVGTVGVALHPCTLPGAPPNDRCTMSTCHASTAHMVVPVASCDL